MNKIKSAIRVVKICWVMKQDYKKMLRSTNRLWNKVSMKLKLYKQNINRRYRKNWIY